MKEHQDDVLLSVKESSPSVDSLTAVENVNESGKIEGFFGEREEGDDMMVDVVAADVDKGKSEDSVKNQSLSTEVVDARTGEDKIHVSTQNMDQQAGVDQTSTESLQPTIEVTASDVQRSGNATQVGDPKMAAEPLSGEPQNVEGEIVIREEESKRGTTEDIVERRMESVQEVADGDRVMNEKTKKVEVLNSQEILESVTKVHGVDVEGLAGKDEAQDGVSKDASSECLDNPSLSSDAVDAGTDVGVVHENAGNLDQKSAVDQISKEESSHSTIEVRKGDAQKSGNTTVVGDSRRDDETTSKDPQFIEGKDKEDATERGSTKEIMEQPLITVQEVTDGDGVMDEKTAKDDEPSTIASLGSVEVDAVVVDEGFKEKDKAQDDVSLKQSLVCPDNRSLSTEMVNASTGEGGNEITVELPSTGVLKGSETSVECLDEVKNATTPAGSEFSYEEAHMEREDAGMDIDEVLGWKDETPETKNLSSVDEKVNEDVNKHSGTREQSDFYRNQETKGLDDVTETRKNETTISLHQSCYFHPPESEGEFSVSDLVWGKVRSHPWWPGQIFDPSDASEKAMKYYKKDCFLVAYFGDGTFAWNDSTVLKPFRANFSQIVKVSSSEAFNNAVHSALEEVSRRVELGLTCSCVSHDFYEKIKCQVVENAGIWQEASRKHSIDKSVGVSSFEPDKLVDYVRLLAKFPYGEVDKMELAIAKAQLSSYGRYKGYRQLAEFQFCGNLSDKNDLGDSFRKRKALDSIPDGSEKRPSLHTETATPIAKPAFKVGELIQRAASQLTDEEPVDQTAGVDMLSQLHLAAQDPMKGHAFLNSIIPFFHSHRVAVLRKSRQNSSDARKRKPSNENDAEEFEFDDVNDSYWTDRIIQNYPEEQQPLQDNQNGGGDNQLVPYEQDKPVKPSRRSNKKRFFSSNHEIEAKEQSELIERRRQNLATEVLMKFSEGIYFPSEIHLNKMFRRFGPLMESETEVNRQSGRARVVFKKCSDAEVAHSSAGKFNIFGSISVNYELNYTPLISYKPLPLPMAQD